MAWTVHSVEAHARVPESSPSVYFIMVESALTGDLVALLRCSPSAASSKRMLANGTDLLLGA
eukprot:1458135-Alexandrium_andersonii.AAC.1